MGLGLKARGLKAVCSERGVVKLPVGDYVPGKDRSEVLGDNDF